MSHQMKMVDIIVPIYNAYEHVIKCVDSVIRHTDLSCHRLLLLDDCSSDARIGTYLDGMASVDGIVVLKNEKNLGFSGNINRGIRMSSNDVILLNSDTIVTKRWLDKIQKCAYMDETIATVTPLSNAATICSVPVFCKDNNLPEGMNIDQMAELIEICSLKLYPEIPVAHGYCMYIKRNVIDVIGCFNAEVFARGYGEENDFCYRAEEVGFHHVMCDDTFIYHAGTASFVGDDKKKLIQEHNQYLFKNYPYQMKKVEEYCRDNPNHIVQDNVKFRIEVQQILNNGRKNIMYQVQSDFREGTFDPVGGTQLHVKDLALGLKHSYNIVVVARDDKWLNVTLYSDEKEVRLRFHIGEVPAYMPFRSKQFRKIYDDVLRLFQIDMVHIHHVCGLTLELYYAANDCGIPIVTTLHDFYYLCPSIKMMDYENQLCIDQDGQERCKNCLKKMKNIMPSSNYIEVWRQEHVKALKMSQSIVVPSESTKQIIGRYFADVADKITVITHGLMPLKKIETAGAERKSKTFNVAFLGGVGSPAKGSETICQMIRHSGKDINWFVFGIMGHCDLMMLERDNYFKIGAYSREELPALLNQYEIDLVGILPIWPETYCYTLSESVLCGVPVIASDIGALSERIHAEKCGWIVPQTATADDVLKMIQSIKSNTEEYQNIKNHLDMIKIKSLAEMLNEYRGLYDDILSSSIEKKQVTPECASVLNAYLYAKNGNCSFGSGDSEIYARMEYAEKQLQGIQNSSAYKIALAMEHVHIPCKKQIKGLLYKVYKMMR